MVERWQRDGRENAEIAKGWQKDGGDGRETVERWRRWSAAVSPGATFPSRGRKNRACGPGGNFPEVDRTRPQKKEAAKVTIKAFHRRLHAGTDHYFEDSFLGKINLLTLKENHAVSGL